MSDNKGFIPTEPAVEAAIRSAASLSKTHKTILWFGFGVTLAIIFAFFSGCGKDIFTPGTVPGCSPAPIADAGGDQYISKGQGATIPDIAQIGATAIVSGTNYKWTPSIGLDNANAAQPFASPDKTTVYTLEATNKCGTAVSSVTVNVLKESMLANDTVIALDKNGKEQTYFTGYRPNILGKLRKRYKDFSAPTADPIPLELDLKPYVQRIFRQECGDCWYQATATVMETLLGQVDKVSRFVSRQEGIDCSGFGSCGGGQMALENLEKGVVYESDYPYQGRTGRCNKSVPRHEATKGTFFISDNDLNWPNLQRAVMEHGPLEICGSSSALGNGGWVSRNPGGGTDHCYALVGWYDGATHGKPPGSYGIIANSWGTGWGDDGYGYYLLAKDGKRLDGNVITEASGTEYKSPCPAPVVDAGPDRTIVQIPGTPQFVKLGTPAIPSQFYKSTPADSLNDASIAQPLASPTKTTKYTVETTNACGASKMDVTVHVWRKNANGFAVEILH